MAERGAPGQVRCGVAAASSTICPGAGEAADAGKGKGKGKKKRPRDTVDEFFLGSSP